MQVESVLKGRVPHNRVVEVLIVVFEVSKWFRINLIPRHGLYGKLRDLTMLLILLKSFMLLHHSTRTRVLSLFRRFVAELAGDEIISHHRSVEATNEHISEVFRVHSSAREFALFFVIFKLDFLDNIKPSYVHQDIRLCYAAPCLCVNF